MYNVFADSDEVSLRVDLNRACVAFGPASPLDSLKKLLCAVDTEWEREYNEGAGETLMMWS